MDYKKFAIGGLKKLAGGSSGEVEIGGIKLNLFNISKLEISDKGTIKVEFASRQDALEKLYLFASETENQGNAEKLLGLL
ncbi:MAG: hypothetical protein LBL93_06600 [Ruminococcus sp.]|jgi:hypothetical protein|nr:hypothetical protein [Ruminococcus sp.]